MLGYLLVAIPSPNGMATVQSNAYYYADGSPLAREGRVNRDSVALSRVPLSVRRAVLAAEDKNFYSGPPVDLKAMARGAWYTFTGNGRQSGSTITQQYVKNYYLNQEQTVSRKLKELFISVKLEREKNKDEIFEGYLNTVFFGRNSYGIESASRAYYGKGVDRLGPAEGAYLAVLLNAPSQNDVLAHPERRPGVKRRWGRILDAMVRQSWLTAAERDSLKFPMPRAARPSSDLSGQRGYIVEAVKEYLVRNGVVEQSGLAAGGYKIVTTINRERQDDFLRAVQSELVESLDAKRRQDRYVRVGGVSLDPASGEVVALYGGYDYTRQFVSNATRHDYQVGSSFKPLVLAAALAFEATTRDGRRITPETVYDGTSGRQVETSRGASKYAPGNEDGVNYGPITVQAATAMSVNSVYAQLAADVGEDRVAATAVAMGIPVDTPGLAPAPAIALGAARASVLELTGAYATLANHGLHQEWTMVKDLARNGDRISLPARESVQVIPRKAADTTTAVLVGAVEDGTGTAAKKVGRPAAGKTGTAEEDRAAWFAGYTPELVTVVSVMGQDPDTGALRSLYGTLGEERVSGGSFPARIWASYTQAALRRVAPSPFILELR
ncbi:transglycosylase domain-containing protein [Streptomyces cyaneofuscatus]|uniref:transglycosylase domain-containing protein n=1 Tax=Streptomyces cyaneofuscatus TaxID=66883 RepID=UPI003800D609